MYFLNITFKAAFDFRENINILIIIKYVKNEGKFLTIVLCVAGSFLTQKATACQILATATTGTPATITSTYSFGLAYNPIKNVYYAANGGNNNFPISTYSATGTLLSTVNTTDADYKGCVVEPKPEPP